MGGKISKSIKKGGVILVKILLMNNSFLKEKVKAIALKLIRLLFFLLNKLRILNHCILNKIRGKKSSHLIVCGCPRSGTTLLYNMLVYSNANTAFCPKREISALNTFDIYKSSLITKRPLDLFKVEEIIGSLSGFRKLFIIVLFRDPRDLVSSMHRSVPGQFFQSMDYQFFCSESVISFSNPGVIEFFNKIESLKKSNSEIFFLKYEDLINDPESIRNFLNKMQSIKFSLPFEDFYKENIPDKLKIPLNGLRPIEKERISSWIKNDRIKRVVNQIKLYPVIEQIARDWGYPAFDQMVEEAVAIEESFESDFQKGIIIAFHTDDELYINEVSRLRKSLDYLDLPYYIESVSSNNYWVENCAMKPDIIIKARRKFRGPLLYIDVDTFVHSDPWPYLSQYDGDIAVYVDKTGLLVSGTIFINDTEEALSILQDWSTQQKNNKMVYDQEVLRRIIEEAEADKNNFNIQRLPVNFNYIFDKKNDYIFGDVIIEHLQVSRESSKKWGDIKKPSPAVFRRKQRIKELDFLMKNR